MYHVIVFSSRRQKMNPLDRQLFYIKFRGKLRAEYGRAGAEEIWRAAGEEYSRLLARRPDLKAHRGRMVLPAAALYLVMDRGDAERLLGEYGDETGKFFAGIVHALTSLPGVSSLIWRNMEGIMDRMSSEDLGYKRRIVSRPPDMYGVDILSCPYHELAKELGAEKAVLCICRMDKAYIKGFCHIRYERSTAVSEGAKACDYRLRRGESGKRPGKGKAHDGSEQT
jgi:hypothetical protein